MHRGRERAAWDHTAALQALIYNVNRGKSSRELKPIDFHPYYQQRKRITVPMSELAQFFK